MMLSGTEEHRTHDAGVVSIKQEPDDNVDWIIEENIHSDEEEYNDSCHVNDKQGLPLEDKESVTVKSDSPTSKLKCRWESKQKTNLSKALCFNSLNKDLKWKSLAKQKCIAETKHSVSKDILEDKKYGREIKHDCCEINDRAVDCQNSDYFLQSCSNQESLQFEASHSLPEEMPNVIASATNSLNSTHLTLQGLLRHVPDIQIYCLKSTILPEQTTFINKPWLSKLKKIIHSKPKRYDKSEDNHDKQISDNFPAGNQPTTERSTDDKKQESEPKLLTTQTVTSLLKPGPNELASEQQFNSEECDKTFVAFHSLMARKKYHRWNKKLVCTACQKEFTVKREYDRHIRKHKECVLQVCPLCNKTFHVVGAMKKHMLIHEQQPASEDRFYAHSLYSRGIEKCPVCSKSYSKYYIKHHMNIHSSTNPHVCILCAKTFTHKHSLETHKLKHRREMVVWNCKHCDQKFNYEYLLKRHMKLHIKYKCDKCDKTLKNRASYLSHWRTHNRSSYTCHVCNKTYSRYSAYFSHYQTHKNVDYKPLPEKTGDVAIDSLTIIDKRNDHSVAIENFNDEMGSHNSTTKHTTENYLLNKVTADSADTSHSGGNVQDSDSPLPNSEPFEASSTLLCHLCKWDASCLRSLKRHLLIHKLNSKEVQTIKADVLKLYKGGVVQCPVCEEYFSRYYIRHHIKIHSKDRPYSCNMCDKSFVYKTSLVSHVHGHQKKQMWSCDLWDENLLEHHMKTHGSSDTIVSKKVEDLSAENNVSISTCLPEPSIEIDNGEEETENKDDFKV